MNFRPDIRNSPPLRISASNAPSPPSGRSARYRRIVTFNHAQKRWQLAAHAATAVQAANSHWQQTHGQSETLRTDAQPSCKVTTAEVAGNAYNQLIAPSRLASRKAFHWLVPFHLAAKARWRMGCGWFAKAILFWVTRLLCYPDNLEQKC